MKYFFIFFLLPLFFLYGKTEADVSEFLRKLDGNFKERREASKQLHNLPVEFYPYLRDHLKTEKVSTEVKLRLSKDKMFPLRAKWLLKKRLDWYQKNVIEAYRKHGHRDSKWDKHVFNAFEIVLKQFNEDIFIKEYSNSLAAVLEKAIRKGCQDPIVHYFYARAKVRRYYMSNNLKLLELHLSANEKLIKSNYHPFFKYKSTRLVGAYWPSKLPPKGEVTPQEYLKGIEQLIRALSYLSSALDDKSLPFSDFYHEMNAFYNNYEANKGTVTEGFQLIEPMIKEKFGADSIQCLAITGWFWSSKEARALEPSQKRIFSEKAISYLSRAWRIDPARKEIAVRILFLAHKTKDKERVKRWYDNSVLAEPDNFEAMKIRMQFYEGFKNQDLIWQYADEIAETGGSMIKRLSFVFKILCRDYMMTPKHLLWEDAAYRNGRIKEILTKAYTKYFKHRPDDFNFLCEYAYYMAFYGHWVEAYTVFQKIENLNEYNGLIPKQAILSLKEEAELYHTKKLPPPQPYFEDTEKRLWAKYEHLQKKGYFNFLELYKQLNGGEAGQTLETALLNTAKKWNTHPEKYRDFVSTVQKPYEVFSEFRKAGNDDTLIYFLWALHKDDFYKEEKSHTFLAAQSLLKSQYPSHLKLLAILKGIDLLSKQKKISENELNTAKELAAKVPELITEFTENLYYFRYFYSGLRNLGLLDSGLVDKISKKFEGTGSYYAAYINRGFYTYELIYKSKSQLKSRKEIVRFSNKSKQLMKKAWLENPYDFTASYYALFCSQPLDKDNKIYQRRSRFNDLTSDWSMKDFLFVNGNNHEPTLRWTSFPNLRSRITLLHYYHMLKYYKDVEKDLKTRASHWKDISNAFEQYLNRYPGDSYIRSQYAKYAAECLELQKAKEQLNILGKYGHPKVFGGAEKMKEYQQKFLLDKSQVKDGQETIIEK